VSPREVWSPPVVVGRWMGSHGPVGRGLSLRPGNLVGLWSVGLACLKGVGRRSGDHECLWITTCQALGAWFWWRSCHACGSLAWQALGVQANGDCAGLCRCEGHSPVEIVNICGLVAWQALGACPAEWRSCRPVQALGAWPS
jgi:hypothetical protein